MSDDTDKIDKSLRSFPGWDRQTTPHCETRWHTQLPIIPPTIDFLDHIIWNGPTRPTTGSKLIDQVHITDYTPGTQNAPCKSWSLIDPQNEAFYSNPHVRPQTEEDKDR